jgi:hypothetical protein
VRETHAADTGAYYYYIVFFHKLFAIRLENDNLKTEVKVSNTTFRFNHQKLFHGYTTNYLGKALGISVICDDYHITKI